MTRWGQERNLGALRTFASYQVPGFGDLGPQKRRNHMGQIADPTCRAAKRAGGMRRGPIPGAGPFTALSLGRLAAAHLRRHAGGEQASDGDDTD